MGHIYSINSQSLRKQRTLSGSQSLQIRVQLKIDNFIIRGRRGMHIGHWWESQKERDH
jgi:hypothetical protein